MDEREVRQKLGSFLEQVKSRYRIERAILFGSRARGDYLKESDIDLILVSPDFQGIPFPDRPTPFYSFWERNDKLFSFFMMLRCKRGMGDCYENRLY